MDIILLVTISFVITFVATYFVRLLALKYKLVDNRSFRKHPAQVHTGIIPRAGGLGIFLGIFVTALLFVPTNKALMGIGLGAFLTVAIGLYDDWNDLNPYIRFFANIISALFVIAAGVSIPYISNPLGGTILLNTVRFSFDLFGNHSVIIYSDLIAILFIVWTMNIVGWSSGVDGQLPGFVAIASLVLGVLSLRFSAHDISQWSVMSLAFITMGAYLGFLPWNYYPQKIMPGYSGKSLAGFMLATLSILSGAKVGTMILVLGLPMADALVVIISRILRGKSPVWADKKHFHHTLLESGWSKQKIALFYWMVSGILGIIALLVSSETKLFTLLTLAAIVGGIVFWRNRAVGEFSKTTHTSSRTLKKSNPQS